MSEKKLSAFLSPLQVRFIGLALTALSLCVLAGFVILILQITQGFVNHFASVLWPLAVAGIIALSLKPLVTLLESRLKIGRKTSIVLIYGAFVVVLAGILALVVPAAIDQFVFLIESLPRVWENSKEFLLTHIPVLQSAIDRIPEKTLTEWIQTLQGHFSEMGNFALSAAKNAGGILNQGIVFATSLLLVPIYLIFFLQMDNNPMSKLEPQLNFLGKQTREDLLFLVNEFVRNVVAYFRGQFIIALILSVLFSSGFSLVGLKFGLVLGIAVGLLNMVPFLGTIFAIIVVLPVAFFQPEGGLSTLLFSLLVLFTVQMFQDYVLTPRIMGKETGLSPLVIIISIFFWGAALNGITGMLLAIPLTSFLIAGWKFVFRRYLSEFFSGEREALSE